VITLGVQRKWSILREAALCIGTSGYICCVRWM